MRKAAHLFLNWKRIEKTLRGKFISLFLDYDGTLAPIAKTPGAAVMQQKMKNLLRQLLKLPNCKIAVVSGRALRDISRRVGLKNIIYVGNHGFEIEGPKIKFKSPAPIWYKKTLEKIKAELEKALSSVEGVFIEDKGFSLSVHYRLAGKENISKVKTEFYAVLLLHELRNEVRIKTGKMVLEVQPPIPWNKGKVVLWLLGRRLFVMRNKKPKVLPIYIGDDTTDEDAFESLKDKGITIFVGKPKNTKARFYLKDTEEVADFLENILKIINPGAS